MVNALKSEFTNGDYRAASETYEKKSDPSTVATNVVEITLRLNQLDDTECHTDTAPITPSQMRPFLHNLIDLLQWKWIPQ
jgi:hypothetical protein